MNQGTMIFWSIAILLLIITLVVGLSEAKEDKIKVKENELKEKWKIDNVTIKENTNVKDKLMLNVEIEGKKWTLITNQ